MPAERSIRRSIALNIIASLVKTCKLNDVDPPTPLSNTHPPHRLQSGW